MRTPKSEEIKTLKKDFLEKTNALSRVDASAFKIKRVKGDINYLRAYLFQLMNDDFGLSESCRDEFETMNKKIEELSEIEIFKLLRNEVEVDVSGIPVEGNNYIEFYHFNNHNYDNSLDYSKYPELFTDLRQISFDQGGLLVFELYETQIYKLFNLKGQLITGPCHDLDILINGKYIERGSDNRGGFHLSKYFLLTDSVSHIKSFSDVDGEVDEYLNTNSRDRLQIEIGKSVPERIENFKEPKSKNEAKLILQESNCNWITSPELVKYYEEDKELALLAVSREPLAYSLLSTDLMLDESIQKVLCFSTNWNLLFYIKEWNLVVENILTLDEICKVLKTNRNLLSMLSNNLHSNAECLMAALSNDVSNIKYADESLKKDRTFALEVIKSYPETLEYFDDFLKSNKEIVLEAIKNNYLAIQYCSEQLRSNEEFICEAYKLNHNIIRFIDDKTIKQYTCLKDLYNDYKSREDEQEDDDDLPF
jgi:hypothetical protein